MPIKPVPTAFYSPHSRISSFLHYKGWRRGITEEEETTLPTILFLFADSGKWGGRRNGSFSEINALVTGMSKYRACLYQNYTTEGERENSTLFLTVSLPPQMSLALSFRRRFRSKTAGFSFLWSFVLLRAEYYTRVYKGRRKLRRRLCT